MEKTNLVLIGMPGAGKSTAGVLLAKKTALKFLDTDVLIQAAQNRMLQEIIDQDGYLELRRIERDVILTVTERHCVIATGGSAAYHAETMKHLKKDGKIIFLDVRLETLYRRVKDFGTRGIAKRLDQTFEDVFQERKKLYELYADITIDANDLTMEDVARVIMMKIA
ncbi:MAG: shikimate kinase [Syntrophaceae bacterium]|nr:MAG: shikimate kinase [Syntrophaceae bacterium]